MNQVQYRVVWPPFSRSIIALAVIFFSVWFASVLISDGQASLFAWAALSTEGLLEELRVWTLVTHAFVHADFFGVFFSALALWLFGGELEKSWGTARWWLVTLATILLGALITFPVLYLAGGAAYYGFHGPIMMMITAYCRRHWRDQLNFFFFPMSGKIMFFLFAGLSVGLGVLGNWSVIPSNIAGILIGWFVDPRSGGAAIRSVKTRWRMWRARHRLKVVKTPEQDKPSKPNGTDRRHMN